MGTVVSYALGSADLVLPRLLNKEQLFAQGWGDEIKHPDHTHPLLSPRLADDDDDNDSESKRLPLTVPLEECEAAGRDDGMIELPHPRSPQAYCSGFTLQIRQLPAPIDDLVWDTRDWIDERRDGVRTRCGRFLSPAHAILPPECRTAHFMLVMPPGNGPPSAVVLIMPHTGDEQYDYRLENTAVPLALRHNMAAVLLMIPFYGLRRPAGQHRHHLRRVAESRAISIGMFEEARALITKMRTFLNTPRVAVSGISMGGCVAASVGRCLPFPCAISANLAPHSPAAVITDGAMNSQINKRVLDEVEDELGIERLRACLETFSVTALPAPKHKVSFVATFAAHDHFVPQASADLLWEAFERLPSAVCVCRRHTVMGGHVSSFVLQREAFRKGIIESLDLLDA